MFKDIYFQHFTDKTELSLFLFKNARNKYSPMICNCIINTSHTGVLFTNLIDHIIMSIGLGSVKLK